MGFAPVLGPTPSSHRRRRSVLPDACAAQHVLHQPSHREQATGDRGYARGRQPCRSSSSWASPSMRLRCRRCTRRLRGFPRIVALCWLPWTCSGSLTRKLHEHCVLSEATITTRLFRARKQVAERLAPAVDGAVGSEPDSSAVRSSERGSSDLAGSSANQPPTNQTVRGNESRPAGVLSSRGTP